MYSAQADEIHFLGGPSFSQFKTRIPGIKDVSSNKWRTSFHLGVGYEKTLNNHFAIEPRLLFNSKGAKNKGVGGLFDENDFGGVYIVESVSTRLNYLELPIMLKGYVQLNPTQKLFLGVAPYFGVGINGKSITRYKETSFRNVYHIQYKQDGIKRLDFGFKLEGGFVYNKYSFHVFFVQGLINLFNHNLNGTTRNQTFGLGFGYSLALKPKS